MKRGIKICVSAVTEKQLTLIKLLMVYSLNLWQCSNTSTPTLLTRIETSNSRTSLNRSQRQPYYPERWQFTTRVRIQIDGKSLRIYVLATSSLDSVLAERIKLKPYLAKAMAIPFPIPSEEPVTKAQVLRPYRFWKSRRGRKVALQILQRRVIIFLARKRRPRILRVFEVLGWRAERTERIVFNCYNLFMRYERYQYQVQKQGQSLLLGNFHQPKSPNFQQTPKLSNNCHTFPSPHNLYITLQIYHKMQEWQELIISIIGWIYFFAWSFSFYGQIYQNFRHKSVEGMNFDFVAMNLTGFTFYSIYCTYGYFVNQDQTGKVDLNDLLFAYHALAATLLTLSQVVFFPKKKNKIHGLTLFYLLLLWTFVIVYSVLTEGTSTIKVSSDAGVISIMGYFKLSISFLKYLPQLYWNYQRKSTKGWSIANIILDLTGGLLSFAQMALQALFGQDVKINIVKLVLGIMVVFYDILFIVQHYCIYPQKREQLMVATNYEKPALTSDTLGATLVEKDEGEGENQRQ